MSMESTSIFQTRSMCGRRSGQFKSRSQAKAGARHFAGVTVQPMVRRDGYELIVGSSLDPQFGPVILFGTGGVMVEVYGDRALALPPLNTTLAQRLMEQTKIYTALQRGPRAQACQPGGARGLAGSFQPTRHRAASHSRDRHQSPAGNAGPSAGPRCARDPA